ncbi:hypothetical protein AMS68_007878 [Peltaster fructicola]|uniref:C2H2-type domain-containing protein n=1 Tax=Peltaster fructicola TaxID=286661 RepID=A0A6H0Y692_9PEZI|nr:hypothetical protein AMS68_007878 [Peltaster fructicola]
MSRHDYDRDVKMASSPGSSDLSEVPSEEDDDQTSIADISSRPSVDRTHADNDHSHPSKRRKTGNGTSLHVSYERASSSQPEPEDDILSVSEDSFGSAPGSPTHDEYAVRDEAQMECLWKDCDYGRAQNNDDLVSHVQSTHCATGGPKRSKYICEWGECQNKKANVHPSNYALKAHCRSHTKEKPYYCALPECDKAFTRSDALAKHMRTVHEPEPAKGAGPNTSAFLDPPNVLKKPLVKTANGTVARAAPAFAYDENGREIDPSPPNDNITYIPAHHPITGQPGFMIHYPPDVHFSTWESSIRADELMRVLRHQVKWAEDESKVLEQENAELERVRREEWSLKEALLDDLTKTEQTRAGRSKPRRAPLVTALETVEAAPEVEQAPKRRRPAAARRSRAKEVVKTEPVELTPAQAPPADDGDVYGEPDTSPPPTGASGGFDGDDDPYDNYVQGMMKRMQERKSGIGEDDEDSIKAVN